MKKSNPVKIHTNVTGTFIGDKDSPSLGYWKLEDGSRFHGVNSGWSFENGETAVGDIMDLEHVHYSGDKENRFVVRTFVYDINLYKMPDYYYDFFENREVKLNSPMRGNFESDCKLCGAKRVCEMDHAKGCMKNYPTEVKRIQDLKRKYLNSFKGDGIKVDYNKIYKETEKEIKSIFQSIQK